MSVEAKIDEATTGRSTRGTAVGVCLLCAAGLSAGAAAFADGADPAQSLRLSVQRSLDGRAEVLATGAGWSSRITGFDFDAGPVWLGQHDFDHDGDADIVVSNVRSGAISDARESPGAVSAAAARPMPEGAAVYAIVVPAEGLAAELDVSARENGIDAFESSVRGDRDNFGYGPGLPPRCLFYDNREPVDLRVFDFEAIGRLDGILGWRHTFSSGGTPDLLVLRTAEIFAERVASTIDLDDHRLDFATEPFGICGNYPVGGITRVFVLSGSDAEIAADGAVLVTFRENDDDVSVEWSFMTIRVPSPNLR